MLADSLTPARVVTLQGGGNNEPTLYIRTARMKEKFNISVLFSITENNSAIMLISLIGKVPSLHPDSKCTIFMGLIN